MGLAGTVTQPAGTITATGTITGTGTATGTITITGTITGHTGTGQPGTITRHRTG